MKRKLVIFSLIVTLVALTVVAACAPAPAPAPTPAPAPAPTPAPAPAPAPTGETFTWTFAVSPTIGVNGWTFTPYPRFQMAIEEATGGRLKLNLIEGLFPPAENIYGVIDGRADIAVQWTPYVSGTFPLWDFASFPFMWESVYEYEKAVNDPRMLSIMEKTYGEAGLVLLMDFPSGPVGDVWANKPIRTVADFEGLKTRATGLLNSNALKALGAAPLTLPFPELADALSRGTVDAVFTVTGWGLSVGLADVTEYSNLWDVGSEYGNMLVANKESFDALPADLQQILLKVAKEIEPQMYMGTDVLYRYAAVVLDSSTTVIVPERAEVAKAKELTRSAIDEWLKVAGPYGPEVLAIVDEYAGKTGLGF